MTHYYKHMDQFAVRLANAVIRWRWVVLIAMLALAVSLGSGARHLEFASNFRVFSHRRIPNCRPLRNCRPPTPRTTTSCS
jgi:hypothetical protein